MPTRKTPLQETGGKFVLKTFTHITFSSAKILQTREIAEVRTRFHSWEQGRSIIEISTNHTACIGKFLRGTWHFDWLANNSIVILLLRSECYTHKCYTTVARIREFFSLARLYKAAASQPSLLTRLLVGNNINFEVILFENFSLKLA